jgi:glutathione S-transferase
LTAPRLHFHHYASSPFAEKVRLVFGLKGLAWHSVLQPSVMPKPDLQALTGGYRRIPVLQVGSDVVCDSALICEVLEQISPEKTLYPDSCKGEARVLAQWADSTLFAAAMAYNFQPAGAAYVFKDAPPEALKAFAADRAAMRGGATRMAPGDATAAYKSYLRRIAHMLHRRAFVLGDAPCIADFSIYHSLWFTQHIATPLAKIFDATPEIAPWLARMAALGHGQMHKSSATEAIASAAMNTAAESTFPLKTGAGVPFVDDHGIPLGSAVSVKAESFGLETTEGHLLAATRTRITIARSLPTGEPVRVHFPKVGYVLAPAVA